MQTILCIEDTEEVQLLVKRTFAGFTQVIAAKTLAEGYENLKNNHIDLILLDLGLPDGDGYQFFSKLSDSPQWKDIPVIILTSKNQVQDKIMGFHLGAEDYIVKPFDPAELKIRAETRLRRRQAVKDNKSILQLGNLTINHLEQRVFIQSQSAQNQIELTTTEFKILSYLAKHKDQVLTREQIISTVWKHGFNISDRTIDSHISRIRKKISASDHTIQATQGVGYKFIEKRRNKKIEAA